MDKELSKFHINVNGVDKVCDIIMNFELFEHYYCIYSVKNDNDDYDIFCGEVIGNEVCLVSDERDKKLLDKIVLLLVNAIKEREV